MLSSQEDQADASACLRMIAKFVRAAHFMPTPFRTQKRLRSARVSLVRCCGRIIRKSSRAHDMGIADRTEPAPGRPLSLKARWLVCAAGSS